MFGKSILVSLIAAYLAIMNVEATTLTCAQMQALAAQYFPAQYQTDMICIAQKESSWNPNAKNPGSTATGLWQDLASHCGEICKCTGATDLENPDVNAACAAAILSRQGLNAWVTWSSGKCNGWNTCMASGTSSSAAASSAAASSTGSGSSSGTSGTSGTSGSDSSSGSGSTSGSGSSSGSGSGSSVA